MASLRASHTHIYIPRRGYKEAASLVDLTFILPLPAAPLSQQPAWDANTSLWRAVRPMKPIPVGLYDIITGNRILAKPMKN